MLRIDTMTLNQTVARLRELGIKTTEVRVGLALQAGKYPWGIAVKGEQHWIYEIYTKLFEEWVAERAIEVA